MLEREDIDLNHKKLRRLYREEGLAVKRRRLLIKQVRSACGRNRLCIYENAKIVSVRRSDVQAVEKP